MLEFALFSIDIYGLRPIIIHNTIFYKYSYAELTLINENSYVRALTGTFVTTDADAGQTKSSSIVSGNTNFAFAINASTGVFVLPFTGNALRS